jgi:hypothetical protein
LRDTGTTMGNEMVTVVATTLTRVLEAAIDSGTINIEAIICHVDALALVSSRHTVSRRRRIFPS